jgi:hypothetical protein
MKKHKLTSALVRIITQISGAKGYKLFWGTQSRRYTSKQDIGAQTSYRVPGLIKGVTYYFSAKSYNDSVTSNFGNEVKYVP